MITLYHGSNIAVRSIDLSLCNPYKDFGQAFYLTTEINQAQHIADARVDIFGGVPVINSYQFDESLLYDGSLAFKTFDGYTAEWADFIYRHRDETIIPPFMHSYDIVYGPIADDRVGLQIRNYRLGNIDRQEFLRRLQYMKGVTFQYAFCTQRAVNNLRLYECK